MNIKTIFKIYEKRREKYMAHVIEKSPPNVLADATK
jgi:hypothetical protein